MVKVGTVVRYGQVGLCCVEEIRAMATDGTTQDYYVLSPLFKQGSVLYVPVENKELVGRMCLPLTVEEAEALLEQVKDVETEWNRDFRRRSEQFKKALASSDRRDVLLLLKTIYDHKKQGSDGKKFHTADDYYLKDAENLIFSELAYVRKTEVQVVAREIRVALGYEEE